MDEIRCPNCEMPNPAEAETCWNCQARLKQAQPPPFSDAPGQPDWLNGLRDHSETGDATSVPTDGADQPANDWVSRIRQSSQAEETSAAEEDDWLKQISGQAAPGDEEPAAPAEQLPGWLNDAAPDQPAAPLGTSNDWLETLRATPPEDQPPAATTPGDSSPDSDEAWLSGLAGWQEPTVDSPTPAPETPTGSQPEEAAWFSEPPAGQEPAAQPPAEESEDDLSWLSAFGTVPGQPAETPSSEPQPAEPASQPAAEEAPAEDEDLNWLSNLGSADKPAETPAPAASGEMEWLTQLPTQETQPEQYSSPDGELSDWFGGMNVPPSAEPPASDLPEPLEATPFGDFSGFSDGPASPPPAPSPFTAGILAGEPEAQPAAETPDWLKAFGSQTEPPGEEPPAEPSGPVIMPFASGDMDWLGETGESTPSAASPARAEESSPEGLEEAQMPGWLEAMRPVEAVVPEDVSGSQEDKFIERSGPLAGIVGVVPGEEMVSKMRKPPVYSSRLQLSDRQRTQSALLEEMFSEEAKPRQPRPERGHVPQLVARMFIAVLLIAVAALSLSLGRRLMPLPNFYPPETVNFRTMIDQLPENAPVLLAVDYEPGLSGEMQVAGLSVVEHLMAKKSRLAVMSTVPTGPVLAEALLNQAGTTHPDFQLADKTTNLGFLPGGTAGLQEFASRPQVALQYTLDGKQAWGTPALQNVGSLQQFALAVVLTDNAETARAWIEQVQPRLGSTPLLFVASAQTAPFIQPYLDSQQVAGMVSGLSGGVTYARITQSTLHGELYWDAYQFGLLFTALLILLGGAWQVISSLLARKPAKKGA